MNKKKQKGEIENQNKPVEVIPQEKIAEEEKVDIQLVENYRYNEINKQVYEFNKSIEESINKYNVQLKQKGETEENISVSPKQQAKNDKFLLNLFNDPKPWKPNLGIGRFFDNFSRLEHKRHLSNVELNRIHLAKRSYSKDNEFISKEKDQDGEFKVKNHWNYNRLSGKLFGESNCPLGASSKEIVNTIISEHNKTEQILKDKEASVEKYRKSKPAPIINKWKCALNQKALFSFDKIDEVYKFDKPKKEHFRIPFLRPNINGDVFEKIKYI